MGRALKLCVLQNWRYDWNAPLYDRVVEGASVRSNNLFICTRRYGTVTGTLTATLGLGVVLDVGLLLVPLP